MFSSQLLFLFYRAPAGRYNPVNWLVRGLLHGQLGAQMRGARKSGHVELHMVIHIKKQRVKVQGNILKMHLHCVNTHLLAGTKQINSSIFCPLRITQSHSRMTPSRASTPAAVLVPVDHLIQEGAILSKLRTFVSITEVFKLWVFTRQVFRLP